MKKMIFNVSDLLVDQINATVERWGFANRAEFFRHASIEFLRSDGRLMPADETLHEHRLAILSVKAHREKNIVKAAWNKANPYLTPDMG
jgi:metal-responsive CopG/Arc/MetJ family transcriptional regulator